MNEERFVIFNPNEARTRRDPPSIAHKHTMTIKDLKFPVMKLPAAEIEIWLVEVRQIFYEPLPSVGCFIFHFASIPL